MALMRLTQTLGVYNIPQFDIVNSKTFGLLFKTVQIESSGANQKHISCNLFYQTHTHQSVHLEQKK